MGLGLTAAAAAPEAQAQDRAVPLRSAYESVAAQGTGHIAGSPIHLRAEDRQGRMAGEILARLDRPFEVFRRELSPLQAWCPLLILHLNVKYCRPRGSLPDADLLVGAGTLQGQSLDNLYWARFSHRLQQADAQRFQLELLAPDGPLGTRDYRISVEAEPWGPGQTVVRLTYAYRYGAAARLALQAYLGTVGRHRRGFSVVGRAADGTPELVGGVMGMLERNTMRYYLALQAWLDTSPVPAEQRWRRALELNYELNERFPRQLHELDRAGYLDAKQSELRRQEREPPPADAFD